MALQVDSGFDDRYAFAFEELFLEGGVGLADEDFAAFAEHAMPGNAFAGGCGGHGTARGASPATEAQNLSERPIR